MKTRITTTESVRSASMQQQILFVAAAGREKERGKFQLKKKKSLTTRPSFPFAALSLLPSLFLSGSARGLAATCFKIRGGRSARGAGGEKGKGKVRKEGVVKIRAGRKKFP